MATRVAILGATGYSALELIKILLRHPQAQITVLTSRQADNPSIERIHPSLIGRLEMRCEEASSQEICRRADCVFGCLPHGVTTSVVPQLLDAGARVIDLSADYRLADPKSYAHWYDQAHGDPAHLAEAVYGLPELFRDKIPGARLIANPGCYPTSAILPLAPLVRSDLIEPSDIIIDSKSGISGAGRAPKLTTLYPECNESIAAYNVGKHRHTPEIEEILERSTGQAVEVVFTPHLTPMDRGILTTIYSRPRRKVTEAEVRELLAHAYRDEPFVKVVEHLPATKDTTGTNFCHIAVRVVRNRIVTVSVEDNLIKGAAGQAVQNFNLMFGYPETTALL